MRKIKVIKRKSKAEEVQNETKSSTHKANAREMVDNVKDWVNDFRIKKQDETKQAFDSLFVKTAQNLES